MEKKIYGSLRGNLGNQLFVYATLRAMAEKYYNNNCRIIINDKDDVKDNRLRNFNLADNVEFTDLGKPKLKEFIWWHLYAKKAPYDFRYVYPKEHYEFEKKIQPVLNLFGIYQCEDGYLPLPAKMGNAIMAEGFFQSEKYFGDIREMLLKELRPRFEINRKAMEIYNKAKTTNSVCLSIRLGDYVKNPLHDVCGYDYYSRAINYIKDLESNSTFFLFSDEVDKARRMFPDINFICENEGNEDYEKLYIMSSCKHFIISNSSFSWWVQYLNKDTDKIVVAPDKWYNADIPCDLYSDRWTLLKA